MYKIACPACGAEVQFQSAASVMAVCQYCHSTLLRDADSVRNIGRMSDVIEDHSRIQITTEGQYQGKQFSVVGRIQLRYPDGFWNEWYLLFNDGSAGWLSDGSGQYTITLPGGKPNRTPGFEQIHPGSVILWHDQKFTATDIRTAQCVAGEGELPFQVGSGWQARVADFRYKEQFLTLDYSGGDTPEVFLGIATTLEGLKCERLREADQVETTAGKLQGRINALECPNCGSGIDYAPGKADHLICPSCHAQIQTTGAQTEVLKKNDALGHVHTTLQLGDTCNLDNVKWRLIGLMRCRESTAEDLPEWTEYLFFDAKRGFMWLVETDHGWTRTSVLNKLPEDRRSSVYLNGKTYTKQWEYGAEVTYAAGAFNWRVSIGDQTRVTDYVGPDGTLSLEMTAAEITWSLGREISAQRIAKACGKTPSITAKKSVSPVNAKTLKNFASTASMVVVILNLIFFEAPITMLTTGIALLLLWGPVWFYANGTLDDQGDD
jgi:hypothetical protein